MGILKCLYCVCEGGEVVNKARLESSVSVKKKKTLKLITAAAVFEIGSWNILKQHGVS